MAQNDNQQHEYKAYKKEDAYETLGIINTWIGNMDTKVSFALTLAGVLIGVVLVYKCGQEKLNNLYYQVKEQRRCSAWQKTKNPTPRNSSSRSWICTMPEELRIHNWNVNMA